MGVGSTLYNSIPRFLDILHFLDKMVTTRSKTRKAAAARAARKSVAPTRRSSRVRAAYWKKNRCWSRVNDAGAPYTVCSGSKGQKGVYKKKKGRKTRKGKSRRAQRGGVGSGCTKGVMGFSY